MFEYLMISQGSLKLSLILKLLFAFCYSDWLMSASLFSSSLIHSFVLANWLSIPSNVFFFNFSYCIFQVLVFLSNSLLTVSLSSSIPLSSS